MVKVSIEVHDGAARFMIAVKAQSIRQALSIVEARYLDSVTKVKVPSNPESFFLEASAA